MEGQSERRSADELRRLLQHARWRVRTAAMGGPEWDAATAAVHELEQELQNRGATSLAERPSRAVER